MAQPPVAPEDIWRAFNTPGNSLSGPYQPRKVDIVALQRWLIDNIENLLGSTGVDPSGLNGVKAALQAEIDRAKAEEGRIGGVIDTERTDRQTAINTEAKSRLDADSALQLMFDASLLARIAGRLVSRAEVMELVSALAAPPLAMPRLAYATADGRAVVQARRKILFLPIVGQSLAIRGVTGNAFSTAPLPISRGIMPVTGLRCSDVRITDWVGLREGTVTASDGVTNESMATSFVSHLNQTIDAIAGPPGPLTPVIATAICALGGRNFFEIKEGAQVFRWMTNALTDLAEWAHARGYEVECPGLIWCQGENDVFFTNGYDAMLVHVQQSASAAVKRVLGQTTEPLVFFNQVGRVVGTQATTGQRLQADQLQAAFTNPHLRCVGPNYAYEQGDVVHKSSRGAYGMGMLFARGVASALFGQSRYVGPGRPLMPRRAPGGAYEVFFISPTELRINLHVPVEPLVIDASGTVIRIAGSTATYDGTTWISPGMQSFRGFNAYRPDGSKEPIADLTLFSATTTTSEVPGLKLTFTNAPAVPYLRISYAENRDSGDDGSPDGPMQGARGCIRDSANHAAIYDGALDYNWMVMWSQRVPVFQTNPGTF